MPPNLLERDDAMARLSVALNRARSVGQLVAISGEAGIGKSTLLQAWAALERERASWLWGYCEALGTPRPLGPLLDLAEDLGERTTSTLRSSAPRHEVFTACLADLTDFDGPVVVCIEDVHWADDATLDLLQFLARRLHATRAVLALTWRADEISVDHAVHRVLSSIVPNAVHRISLAPLSRDAVATLAQGRIDADSVFTLTHGNPFFVAEVLRGGGDDVPASVRDAVLARRTTLDTRARAILDLVAVVPSRVELSLLADAAPDDVAGLEACVAGGLLLMDGQTVHFRHELARLAIAGALPVPRAQACHRRMLQALLRQPDRDVWLARIVHHAEASGAADAVLEHAPAAARQAARVGAHHQAVDHYRRALRYETLTSAPARIELSEALAYEHYLTGDIAAAQAARRSALDLASRVGDRQAVGRNTRWLSRLAWFVSDGEEALRRADEAIAVLEPLPESAELAMAYSNRSQIAMLREDYDGCLAWGAKAIALARALRTDDVLAHALNNVGAMRAQAGESEGRLLLQESLALALAGDLHEHVARAYTNLGSTAVEWRAYDTARSALDAGLAYCLERDLDSWTYYMRACRARMQVEIGLWPAATEDAEAVLGAAGAQNVARIVANLALGLVRVRRGDPASSRALDEALIGARSTGEPQRLIPILLAHAEHAWQEGRRHDAAALAREAIGLVGQTRREYERGRAMYWLWKAGALDPSEVHGTNPDVSLIHGAWQDAAAAWERLGCPYERAQALVEGDRQAVERALEIFHGLGAAPSADRARQRLRELGVASVPRGRRASTLSHPAGLTVRESEVLALLAQGLTNPQIADRMFVSAKTVEHHVSAILGKLRVDTREAAAVRARREGWLPEK